MTDYSAFPSPTLPLKGVWIGAGPITTEEHNALHDLRDRGWKRMFHQIADPNNPQYKMRAKSFYCFFPDKKTVVFVAPQIDMNGGYPAPDAAAYLFSYPSAFYIVRNDTEGYDVSGLHCIFSQLGSIYTQPGQCSTLVSHTVAEGFRDLLVRFASWKGYTKIFMTGRASDGWIPGSKIIDEFVNRRTSHTIQYRSFHVPTFGQSKEIPTFENDNWTKPKTAQKDIPL